MIFILWRSCESLRIVAKRGESLCVVANVLEQGVSHPLEGGIRALASDDEQSRGRMTLALRYASIVLRVARNTPRMKSLLIVYHSQSGTCAHMATASWRGAQSEAQVSVSVMRAWDAGTADLSLADGVLLVMAENSGALCGAMKDFLDRTFYPAIARGLVLPYALLISAGNDGRGAQRQAERILSGYPFPCAAEPVILRGPWCSAHQQASYELGQAFAAGLSMGIF